MVEWLRVSDIRTQHPILCIPPFSSFWKRYPDEEIFFSYFLFRKIQWLFKMIIVKGDRGRESGTIRGERGMGVEEKRAGSWITKAGGGGEEAGNNIRER